MHDGYKVPVIRELRDQQVRFAPRHKRIAQVDRAEKLLVELEPERTYTFEYICYRVTDFRPEATPNVRMQGADAAHDLRLLIEDLSDSADLRADDVNEPVHTVDDLSAMFNVSSKTISRWRSQGLVSRRFIFDRRKRVGFLRSSVDRFVSKNRERVKRGERFSQLSAKERDQIIERARRLAAAGGCPAEVARRIAAHTGRSVETVRYTLRQFDQQNPRLAVFPEHTGPLTEETKHTIYQQHRRGSSVEALAKRYCRTKTSIYRVVNEMRAKRILELPLDFIPSDEFAKRNAEKVIMQPMPPGGASKRVKPPSGLPPYLAALYEMPLLTREQEQNLFRKFNYLKFKASKLREGLDPAKAKSSQMDEIEELYNHAVKIKNKIVQSNLRLVVSIAKRHVTPTEDFFQLVSDGNISLIRAAEKFDYSRGNKFSTYASWAIMKNFARTIPDEFKHRDRYRTSQDEMFTATRDDRANPLAEESAQQAREEQVGKILSCLDEREQRIIVSRFGLNHRQEPQTLKEVGEEMGVTKERVRQIEARALNKLRVAAQQERIDLPEFN